MAGRSSGRKGRMVRRSVVRMSSLPLLVAADAVQLVAEKAGAARRFEHPRALAKRRVVAHMLSVAAGQLGDPVAVVVLMPAGDGLVHSFRLSSEPPANGIRRRGDARLLFQRGGHVIIMANAEQASQRARGGGR